MKIKVMGLRDADHYIGRHKDENFAVISITMSPIKFKGYIEQPHLVIVREDLDEQFEPDSILQNGGLFDAQDGIDVKNFVETHKDTVDYFLIHCDAGISRSRGVAAALEVVYNDGNEREHYEKGLPNPVVRREVLKAYGIEKEYPEQQPVYCDWCGERIAGMITFRNGNWMHSECAEAYDHEKVINE